MSKSYKSLVVLMGIAVLLIGVVFAFSACGGGSGGASLVGTWHSDADSETVTITADTVTVETSDGTKMDFKYTAADGKMTLTMEGVDPITATYKLSGDELTMTSSDGKDTTTYKRVK